MQKGKLIPYKERDNIAAITWGGVFSLLMIYVDSNWEFLAIALNPRSDTVVSCTLLQNTH